MNKITRRLRELSTERVKVKRIGKYPHDVNFKLRPTRRRLKFRGEIEGFAMRYNEPKQRKEW
jgi:hypothetical protein